MDIDGDGIPDINIDTDGDGIPDKNIKNPSEIEKLLKEKGGQDGVHGRVPKTGDENNLLAWLAMLGAAIAVLAGTMRKMRRKDS